MIMPQSNAVLFGGSQPAPAVPDGRLAFDPAEIWPDPEACPDWPMMSDANRLMNPHFGRQDAENRLRLILDRAINRGNATFEPNAIERQRLVDAVFFTEGKLGPWSQLGFGGLQMRPLAAHDQERARAMVEAAHIRGFIRKLDARKAVEVETEADRKAAEAERNLSKALSQIETYERTLADLAGAEARHRQRAADAAAFVNCAEARQQIETFRSIGRQAVFALGREMPESLR